jgi:hypothetical protein
LRIKTRNPRHNNGRHQNLSSERNNGMSRFTNSITAFRMTQPADTFIWPAIIFTRANVALGRLTVRRTIAFVGADFRVLLRFNFTSPFFTSMVQDCQTLFCLLFHSHTSSDRKLKLIEAPIITVTGKAYWDVGHAPKDQSNRRSHLPGYAAWEIHPVMKLTVQ